jgi:hypothetical protein
MGRIGPDLNAAMANTNQPVHERGEKVTTRNGGSITINAHKGLSGSIQEIPDGLAAEQNQLDTTYLRQQDRLQREAEALERDSEGNLTHRGEEQARKLQARHDQLRASAEYDAMMATARQAAANEDEARRYVNTAEAAAKVDAKNREHKFRHGVAAIQIRSGRRS